MIVASESIGYMLVALESISCMLVALEPISFMFRINQLHACGLRINTAGTHFC